MRSLAREIDHVAQCDELRLCSAGIAGAGLFTGVLPTVSSASELFGAEHFPFWDHGLSMDPSPNPAWSILLKAENARLWENARLCLAADARGRNRSRERANGPSAMRNAAAANPAGVFSRWLLGGHQSGSAESTLGKFRGSKKTASAP